jgi:hypothetical protein
MKTKHPFTKSGLVYAAEIISVALLLVFSAGCGSTKVHTENNTNASVGQQLMDLQKAHEQGLINDQDYEKLRKNIIKKN